MNTRHFHVVLTLSLMAASNYCQAATLPSTPFVAALGGVWTGDGADIVPEVLHSSVNSAVIVETGTLPGPSGTYRASLGTAGFSSMVPVNADREVAGGTLWSDGFTVTGNNGQGTLSVSSQVEGYLFGRSEMFYALYASSKPFSLDTILTAVGNARGFWRVELPDSIRVLFTGVVNGCDLQSVYRNCGHLPYENYQGSLEITVAASIPFTYGVPLYVASIFGGGSIYDGSTSFLNSATFGITAPSASSLSAISGTTYAAAVPEPSGWMLLLSGIGLGSILSRRYRSQLQRSNFWRGAEA